MEFEFVDSINLEDYVNLIKDAGWKVLSNKQHTNALNNSMFISSCKCNGKTVGIARLVGDSSTHGLLCDVVVLSEYRHLGIGRKLVENIKNKVYDMLDNNEEFLIELLPQNGKIDFYLNCGFKYNKEFMDGMYLWVKKN